MKKVENAGIKGIKQKRNPAKVKVDDFFHESDLLREAFSRLISNEDPDRVVIIPSVSYGLANVCRNLPFSDGEILVVEHQFPSNIYPWQALESNGFKLKYISAPDSERRGASWNEEILRSIGEQTRVVAIGHIHWSDGTLFDLVAIRKRLDEVGGLLIIDGTQSVGALPFDAKEIRPDALICAGYKWLLGPYSIGLAYYGPAFDQGNPIEENWINRLHSENFSGLVDYQEMYRPSALRYEVGEHSNFILVPMLLKGINQILKWTPEKIQDYTKVLMQETIGELNDLGYQIEEETYRASHLFGVRLAPNVNGEKLNDAFKRYRVSVSHRGDAIRISPHVYNDEMDVRKLLKAMKEPIFAS